MFYNSLFCILILFTWICCILLLLIIAVVFFSTCQKWRNKDVQSINLSRNLVPYRSMKIFSKLQWIYKARERVNSYFQVSSLCIKTTKGTADPFIRESMWWWLVKIMAYHQFSASCQLIPYKQYPVSFESQDTNFCSRELRCWLRSCNSIALYLEPVP